jgi:RNA polymerase primary sigma factor
MGFKGKKRPSLELDLLEINEEILQVGDSEDGQEIVPLERLVDRAKDKSISLADTRRHAEIDDEDDDELFLRLSGQTSTFDNVDDGQDTEDPQPEVFFEDPDPNDAVAFYLREVSKVPLLTHEEEISLSKRIEAGRKARRLLAEGSVPKRQHEDLRRTVEDGWAAREHIITANFRLVVSVAKKYVRRGVPFLDLIQEGNIGLIRATKKFDHRRGFRFSTYATWWIRQAVSRCVADQGRTIRVPVHMGDQINRLRRFSHKLTQSLGRDPSLEELAESLKVSPKKVEELMRVAQRPLSLELPSDDDENHELGEYTADKILPTPVEKVTESIMRQHLKDVLEELPPREVMILQLRYGLVNGKTHTLGEVGKKLGVTRERVRQIEAQALRRLRKPQFKRELEDYLHG